MLAAVIIVFSLMVVATGRSANPPTSSLVPRRSLADGFYPRVSTSANLPFTALSRFHIAIRPQNRTTLPATLARTSDPLSAVYGHHLSKSQVALLSAPAPEGVKAVMEWLQDHGLTPDAISPSGDTVTVRMSLEKANSVLNANYSAYVHAATNTTVLRTLSYSIPAHIDEHLSFIYPTTQFIPPPVTPAVTHVAHELSTGLSLKREDQATSCAEAVTPKCLQTLYNIPSTPATAAGNSIAMSGSVGQAVDLNDLKAFLARTRPDITSAPLTMQSINDTIIQGNSTGSASTAITVQYTVGLATNVSTVIVYPGQQNDTDGIQDLMDITRFLLSQDTLPLVFLTSAQYEETAFQQAPEVAEHLCNAFAQLGARGTSVIVASGDSDSSGTGGTAFPATCPYVTSVGSTEGLNPEIAARFSSGGFSNIFPRPAYQVDAVDGYLQQLGDTSGSSVNTTGRAYPDVSAQGSQFAVEVNGQVRSINSTSASSAMFAAVVALLNDRLLNAGKPSLGFLNPLLYSKGLSGLNDIVSGSSNPARNASSFTATTGWDPVTGLGTPDFLKLLAVVTRSEAIDAENAKGARAVGRSSGQATADAIGGSGLEGLFPFTSSQEQGSDSH